MEAEGYSGPYNRAISADDVNAIGEAPFVGRHFISYPIIYAASGIELESSRLLFQTADSH